MLGKGCRREQGGYPKLCSSLQETTGYRLDKIQVSQLRKAVMDISRFPNGSGKFLWLGKTRRGCSPPTDELQVWSASCSSGWAEEVLSIR